MSRLLYKRQYSTKEKSNFKEPTNRSHAIGSVCLEEREPNIRVRSACLLVQVCVFDCVFVCVCVRERECVFGRERAKHTHTVCGCACPGVRACLSVCVSGGGKERECVCVFGRERAKYVRTVCVFACAGVRASLCFFCF